MGRVDETTNTYSNDFGKKRTIGPDAAAESQARLEAFQKLEPELKRRLVDKGITNVTFRVKGSAAVGASEAGSDIDVALEKYTAPGMEERVVLAVIRHEMIAIKKELGIPFDISIFQKSEHLDVAMRFQAARMTLQNKKK